MIVSMKQITLLVSSKDRDSALKQLRKLGAVHVHEIRTPVSEDIQALESRVDNVERALSVLKNYQNDKAGPETADVETQVNGVITLTQKKDALTRELEENRELQSWFDKWGAISHVSVQKLRDSGIFIRLYTGDKNAFNKIPEDKHVQVASDDGSVVNFALVSESVDEKLDFKEEPLPQAEPADVKKRVAEIVKEIEQIDSRLTDLAGFMNSLVTYKSDLMKRLELNKVKYGMGEIDEIAYLQGFCPEDAIADFEKQAEKSGWGYTIEEPENPADVPTLIKNPKWLRMIQPVFDFMGTLPGYHEQDVSFIFLLFFSIFFAMLVGDGGYGLVFLVLTVVLGRKSKSDFIKLLYVLSITTIVWGLITGNWFGSQAIGNIPFLKMFVIPQLDSFSDVSVGFVMQLSLIVGIIHLSIAHFMAALKKINSLTALADIGWIVVLWGVFFVANKLVLSKDTPAIMVPLLISGAAIILLFANFQKNIIKGILTTLGNLPLDVISSFSDIVSYIRLFAVGFASFIVASSFNEMAIGSGINSVVSGIIAAVILILGHTLNIALCGMSVLVHGVRLNMLEFSGHVGVQWTGKPYKPFKEE
jgi:V/A-type H+-transporting ATPase subunit I